MINIWGPPLPRVQSSPSCAFPPDVITLALRWCPYELPPAAQHVTVRHANNGSRPTMSDSRHDDDRARPETSRSLRIV
ncbi:MAG: hypothetical protein ACXV3F_11385 [Frankiaceae bacterium]